MSEKAQDGLPDPALLRSELDAAHQDLMSYIEQLEEVLAQPEPDRARLTTVRLQLAKLRLVHGPLITRVSMFAEAVARPDEANRLKELRSSNVRLLQLATAHIGKWPIEAVEADWLGYRQATRELLRRWTNKIQLDRQLLDTLLKRPLS